MDSTVIWLVLGKIMFDNDFQITGWTKLDFADTQNTTLQNLSFEFGYLPLQWLKYTTDLASSE